jgi:hypothetical protein
MNHVLLSCVSHIFTLYVKGLALLAVMILWPINLVLWSRVSEDALLRREIVHGPTPNGLPSLDSVLRGESSTPVYEPPETSPQAPVLISFSV